MLIKKGTLLKVNHSRKGQFIAIADQDFDSETENFYPLSLAQEKRIYGLNRSWIKGDIITCRRTLCVIETYEEKKENK
jgi:hypothetical protein